MPGIYVEPVAASLYELVYLRQLKAGSSKRDAEIKAAEDVEYFVHTGIDYPFIGDYWNDLVKLKAKYSKNASDLKSAQ